ncbi:hypothetical protein VNO78_03571 [Psophocarpus tetragonolobus]|uniref:J domain-containing protein n=1 Tax=Psophocarpus tetragonolobus TaxID=3891 RepID=A0AAN9T4F0_PSOTE
MDVLTLSSSLSISKPFHFLQVPKKQQRRGVTTPKVGVSCSGSGRGRSRGVEENLYKILSLTPKGGITRDDIKRAYRSMALRYHPDVCHDGSKKEEWTRMFVKLNAAYTTLSNPTLRAEYDHELGLRNQTNVTFGDESWKRRWQEQLAGLKTRSHTRMTQTQRKQGSGSWASRLWMQNIY